MNRVEFDYMQCAFMSLRASTLVTMISSEASLTIEGRCSRYKSHQTLEFGEGDPDLAPGTLIVANYRYVIGIGDAESSGGPWPSRTGRGGRHRSSHRDDVVQPDRTTLADLVVRRQSDNDRELVYDAVPCVVPLSLVSRFLLDAEDFGIRSETIHTAGPILTVVLAMPRRTGWEDVEVDGVTRNVPVFERREGPEADAANYRLALTGPFADVADRLISAGLAEAALKPYDLGCAGGIVNFCRRKHRDPNGTYAFGALNWTGYEKEQRLIAAYLRTHPDAPVEDEYSRLAQMSDPIPDAEALVREGRAAFEETE